MVAAAACRLPISSLQEQAGLKKEKFAIGGSFSAGFQQDRGL
jgi:hypothetical protein